MRGMGRLFQGAATVDSVLHGDLIERAAEAGLRSLFVGFETLSPANLRQSNKKQNLGRDYAAVVRRLDDLGIKINGSFVFGLDEDRPDVFRRTVDWAVERGITTATFHILTPYPGTALYTRMDSEGRIRTRDWDLYDTRHVVYRTRGMSEEELEAGYWWAYEEFYRWRSIVRASAHHATWAGRAQSFCYSAAWKKLEPLWDALIRFRRLRHTRPALEAVLASASWASAAETPELGEASSPFPVS
jgi:radical SAM superfamily enzyme YgiQ (UPF0313 family)